MLIQVMDVKPHKIHGSQQKCFLGLVKTLNVPATHDFLLEHRKILAHTLVHVKRENVSQL